MWTYVDVCEKSESPRARELNRTGIKNNNYSYQKNKGKIKGKGGWDDVKPLPVTVTIRGGRLS